MGNGITLRLWLRLGDDENAKTRAEAQAFKRACACSGPGRYLRSLLYNDS
jgi:hypothetical protein